MGNVTSTTDPDGNTTINFYDNLDRETKQTDPLRNDTLFWYDPAGDVIAKVDRDERITLYGYDGLDRQVEEQWGVPATHTIVNTFDAAGQLLGVNETDTTSPAMPIFATSYQYAYDQAGRIIRNRMAPGDLPQQAATPYTPSTIYTYDWDNDGFAEPYYRCLLHPSALAMCSS